MKEDLKTMKTINFKENTRGHGACGIRSGLDKVYLVAPTEEVAKSVTAR